MQMNWESAQGWDERCAGHLACGGSATWVRRRFQNLFLSSPKASQMKDAIMKRLFILLSTLFIFGTTATTQDRVVPDPDIRPTKIWNRTGPLGETPKHVTEA